MSNREKIIVFAAALALIYGVYVVFLEPSGQQPTFSTSSNQLENLSSFIEKVAGAFKDGIPEKDSEIIARAEKAWVRDPLIRMRKPVQDEEETPQAVKETQPEGMIIYTGYLEMGTTRLAIINGNEYATGDMLEQGGY
ncbi:MAG: hypothetical protein JRF72_14090, partial [Deltaproteobacteria bacterium]|nr:hypothetical protein [Deltaproteobacteria bacterium]